MKMTKSLTGEETKAFARGNLNKEEITYKQVQNSTETTLNSRKEETF
jgi:hypothetical protein